MKHINGLFQGHIWIFFFSSFFFSPLQVTLPHASAKSSGTSFQLYPQSYSPQAINKKSKSQTQVKDILPSPQILPLDTLFGTMLHVSLEKSCTNYCCSTSTIFYTIDNTDPKTSQTAHTYVSPFAICTTTTIKAYCSNTHLCMKPSPVVSKRFLNLKPLPAPEISPKALHVPLGQKISLFVSQQEFDSTIGIFYTTDGRDPSIFGKRYLLPFSLFNNMQIRAVTVSLHGKELNSPMVSYYYLCSGFGLPEPVFQPDSKNFLDSIRVTLIVPGYEQDHSLDIRYSTDGSDPITSTKILKGSIQLKKSTVLKAVAIKDGYTRSRVSQRYYHKGTQPIVSLVSINFPGGVYHSRIPELVFTCNTQGSMILYTTDGTEPTMASILWNGKPITVQAPITITVKAFKKEYIPSLTTIETYEYEKLPTPTISKISGTTFTDSLVLSLEVPKLYNETPLTILYTTDGSDPSEKSPVYNGLEELVIRSSTLFKFRAVKKGFYPSDIKACEYFLVRRVIYASFIDRQNDSTLDAAVLYFNRALTKIPQTVEFTNPCNGQKLLVKPSATQLKDTNLSASLIVDINPPFEITTEFSSGHYGRIPLPGEFDSEPFLMHCITTTSKDNQVSTSSLVRQITQNDNMIAVTANPFTIGKSRIPYSIVELDGFKTTYGTAVVVKPTYPSIGQAEIIDYKGNQVVINTQLLQDEKSGLLYLIWDGKDLSNRDVYPGDYTAIIAIQQKHSFALSRREVVLTVK